MICDKDIYHFGASLKDLSKKLFVEPFCEIPTLFVGAFSKMDKTAFALLDNLKK